MLPFANQSFNGSAGLTQGGWILQSAEARAGIAYGGAMIYGSSQWGAPKGQGPHGFGNGGQIYAQYQPPSGPIALECQMPVYESAARVDDGRALSWFERLEVLRWDHECLWSGARVDARRRHEFLATDDSVGQFRQDRDSRRGRRVGNDELAPCLSPLFFSG